MADRRPVDVEKLLHWAYQDELPKRQLSSAEGIWDCLSEAGWMGSVTNRRRKKTAQRYAHFGLPDPDAERVEKAVSALPDIAIDWAASAEEMLGHIAPLFRGRDTVMVGTLRTAALVTMHSKMGTRPDWREDEPRPYFVPTTRGPIRPSIVGERLGHNYYRAGTHCPLRWDPSPIAVAQSRADYAAWYAGLCLLIDRLELERWRPTWPEAPPAPWRDKTPKPIVFNVGVSGNALPLHHPRPVAGPTGMIRPGAGASPVRRMTSVSPSEKGR